jgi:hypothetical protein
MKLVIYSSRTQGVDDQILVVRTFNKLPQAKCLLVLEQKPRLGLGGSRVARCYHSASTCTNTMLFLQIWKGSYERSLALLLPVGLLAFYLAFRGWKVEWILTVHLLLFFFFGCSLGVFENFAKKDKVPRMVPSIAQVVFVTSPKTLREPQLPTSMACIWSFG